MEKIYIRVILISIKKTMAKKKAEQKRLLDVVLEKLEDEKFLKKFSSTDDAHKAVHDAIHETLEDGHEITFSKKDLSALASLDASKFSKIHRDKEPPIFGISFSVPFLIKRIKRNRVLI